MRKNKLLIAGIAIAVIAASAIIVVAIKTSRVVPILMYHSIDAGDKADKLMVSPESFARQMEFLRKNHYNIVTLEKAVSYLRNRERPPQKTIAITFDDGFYNNYRYAYPVLKKYDIPATVFIVVNWVAKPGFLDWEEIREMSDSGIVTIGSHTRTHTWLLGSDDRFMQDEVAGSKKILEEKTGKRVGLFCYPMGAFNAASKKAVKDAGYICAVSTSSRGAMTDDLYAIKRVRISGSADNLFVFWVKTTRLYTWLKRHKD